MNPNWAEENLQTIRTLMERSAVYRRALAPIMIFAGVVGIVAAAVGLIFNFYSAQTFVELWFFTAIVVIAGVFLIARNQAIKEKEAFWSPPTKRVAQALIPPLTVGMLCGILTVLSESAVDELVYLWAALYGCALHSAGFFTPRGVRILGWIYIGATISAILALFMIKYKMIFVGQTIRFLENPHCLMGFFFGVLHLAYGAYLYLTEKRKNVA